MGCWRRLFSVAISFAASSSYCTSVIQNRLLSLGTPVAGSLCLVLVWILGPRRFLTLSPGSEVSTSTPIPVAVDLHLSHWDEKVCGLYIQELKAFVSLKERFGVGSVLVSQQQLIISYMLAPPTLPFCFLWAASGGLWEITWKHVPCIWDSK